MDSNTDYITAEIIDDPCHNTDTEDLFSMYANPPSSWVVEIVEGSKRASRVFIDEHDYAYQLNKKRKAGGFLLRCCIDTCSGSCIYIPQTSELQMLRKHCHLPSLKLIEKWKFLSKVKERAENESTKLKTIYEEEVLVYKNSDLPSFEKIKSSLIKIRNKSLRSAQPEASEDIKPPKMEVIEGMKRFSKVYIDDLYHCYQVNRKRTDGLIFLRCSSKGCRGSAIYNSFDQTYEKLAAHSHHPDPQMVTKWRFLHIIKKRAETEATPLKTIYEEEVDRFQISDLPPFKKIESTLHKRRKMSSLVKKGEESNWETQLVGGDTKFKTEISSEFMTVEDPISMPDHQIPVLVSESKPSQKDLEEDATMFMSRQQPNARQEKIASVSTKMKILYPEESAFLKSAKKRKQFKHRKRKQKKLLKIPSYYSSKMNIIEGLKRYSKLYIDEASFLYQLTKDTRRGKCMMKCYTSGCFSRGIFFPEEFRFERTTEHNHPPDPSQIQKIKFINVIKTRAENESTPLKNIYQEEITNYPSIEGLNPEQLLNTLYKRRKKKYPSEPRTVMQAKEQLDSFFFAQYQREFFRQHLRTPDDDSDILVFISSDLQEYLGCSATILFDSNFTVVPKLFEELLIISFVIDDHIFPAVYALLTNASELSYLCLLNYLRNTFPSFSPSTLVTNYKFVLERVIQTAFPHAIINGCWFYYTQSLWHQSHLIGLGKEFFQNEDVKTILKSLMGLPLVPASLILPGVAYLTQQMRESRLLPPQTKEAICSLIKFVKGEWIQPIGIHRLSIFKLAKNINFEVEDLYQLLYKKFGMSCPTFTKFIEKLFHFDSQMTSKFHRFKKEPKLKSRKVVEKEKKIYELEQKIHKELISIPEMFNAIIDVPYFVHHDNPTQIEHKTDANDDLVVCEVDANAASDLEEEEDTKVINVDLTRDKWVLNAPSDVAIDSDYLRNDLAQASESNSFAFEPVLLSVNNQCNIDGLVDSVQNYQIVHIQQM